MALQNTATRCTTQKLARGPFGVQLYFYWTQTGKERDTLSPFGTHPSYLDMMQVSFNTAGE